MDIGVNFDTLICFRLTSSYFTNSLMIKHLPNKDNAPKIIDLLKKDHNKIHIIVNSPLVNQNHSLARTLRILIQIFLIEHNIPFDSIDFNNDENYDLYIDTKKNKLNKENTIYIEDKDWIDAYIYIYEINPDIKKKVLKWKEQN
jgi:hypothetical protein